MCKRTQISTTTHAVARRSVPLLLAVVAVLTACGGGDAAAPRGAANAAAAHAATALFDERGQARLSPVSLVPGDTAARTRNGLYATRDQFAWEELTAMPYTVLLDVDALGSAAAAVRLAEQVRGLRDTRGLAYYVRARNPADAAQVVNTLADAGFAPVFMIV